jgi:hypothetical protein
MSPISVTSSRLQRILLDLAVVNFEHSTTLFADQLGELISLSDAIVLAESLRGLKKKPFTPLPNDDDAKTIFMQARAAMLAFIIDSFTLEGDEGARVGTSPFILPRPNRDTLNDPNAGFVAYQRFYSLHQSEMDHRVLTLRRQLQQIMSGRSTELAQLATLDSSMAETMVDFSRRTFAGVSYLLAKRFYYLHQQYRDTQAENVDVNPESANSAQDEAVRCLQKGAWLDRFIREMQAILLAELELRLMPVIGLIEALEFEVEKT